MQLEQKIEWLMSSMHEDGFVMHESLEELPCIVHINSPDDFRLLFLNKNAKQLFAIRDEDIAGKGSILLQEKVHPDDLPKAVNICQHYLNNLDVYNSISFIQRIQLRSGKFAPFFTTSVLVQDYGLVSFTIQMGDVELYGKNIDDIIMETHFIKEKFHLFAQLTPRETELIKYLTNGKALKEIAARMKVTYETVKSYRKRIYAKLGINQYYELFEFAQAFDIVEYS